MKTQKLHLIILMMFVIGLLQTNTILHAQERATTVNWTGEVPGQTISTNTNVYLTGNVKLNGKIIIKKGVELNIFPNDANRKITRGNFDDNMFATEAGDGTKEGGILRFNKDNDPYTITIDGGAKFKDNDAKKELLNSPNTGRAIVSRGRLRMHHVIIQNIYLPNDNAGAISFDSKGSMPNGNGYYMAVSDLIIRAVKAGTVIMFNGDDHHNFEESTGFVRVEIYNCSSLGTPTDHHGGTIRAVGGVKSNLVLNACKIHDNEAAYGGAAAWNAGNGTSCKLKIIGNTKIYNNVATENGGGISSLSTVELQSAEIYNNRAKKKGGGLCVDTYWGGMTTYSGDGFEVNIGNGVSIHDNTADEAGGGIYLLFQATDDVGFDVNNNPISPQFKFKMTGGSIYNNHAPIGAGVAIVDMAPNRHWNNIINKWSDKYVRNVSISGGSIYDNSPVSGSTDTKGAGIYIAKAKAANIADGSIGYTYGDPITGGGVVTAGTLTIEPTGGNIYGNQANNGSGGGMYIVDEMKNVSPYSSVCNVNVGAVNIYGNTCSGNGAGMYVQDGIVTVSGAKIGVTSLGASSANTATGLGGGIYVNNTQPGVVTTINGGTIINNNGASYGGGIYVNSDIEFNDGTISNNTASYGAGLYANGGTTNIRKGNIQYNEASQDGGGIYANGGTVNVEYAATTDGKIHHNYAGQRGGGLFISSSGSLNLEGKTTLEYNRVPQGRLGGGVYLEGTVQSGASSTDVIIVKDNYASNTVVASSSDITASIRNNIYLPNPTDGIGTTPPETWPGVITVVNDGLNLADSRIGFSVPHNFIPVIYCETTAYLQPTIMNSNAVFEDSERYNKYYSTTSPYKGNFIYLSANTWVSQVTSQPSSGFTVDGSDNVTISNEQGLAWLISYVNGLNGVTGGAHTMENCTVTLTADLDMKANSWVPIGMTGETDKPFKGTFNGNGHTVSNLYCSYLGEGNDGTGAGLGMFGVLDGATVHDVFLNGVELQVHNQLSGTFVMGAIANEIKGNTSIYNCTASSNMESTWANTTMGGLVGKLTSGTIHSSAAMPDMTGYTMGGIVGDNAGTVYNSFANAKFTSSGTNQYMGGLVAVNTGRVENCYSRIQGTAPTGDYFGYLAGNNTSATDKGLYSCYATNTTYVATATGITAGTQSDLNTYGTVVAPYLYAYSESTDNIVSGTSNTLCKQLNAWVSTNNSTSGRPTCASWKRTTAGGYYTSAGNINGDYPIHEHAAYTCAASTNGVDLDYAKSLDDMLTRHTSDATINLYANENNVTKSTGNNEVVYIDENVSLLQGNTTSRITAYTGQTLRNYNDNRWHNVSSSLKQSGIGFNYGITVQVPFNWDVNPCNVTLSSDDDNAFFPSDMPWTATTAQMDFYCFYEPEYHWINLKRNTNSHWHMDATDVPIAYNGNGIGANTNGNETYMVPGKGYLVSIDKDQLIQNKGELNNGDVTLYSVTKTDANEWAGLLGYNLLGNPYQSYLDFEAFMSQNLSDDAEHPVTNAGNLWVGGEDDNYANTYATYDPAQKAYVQYTLNPSQGANTASRYIHPHQGFFVRMTKDNANTNTNTTTVTYTNDMRTNNTDEQSGFRGAGQPRHALVNFVVRDAQGKGDIAVLELNRDGYEGAEKIRMGDGTGHLSLGYEGKAYAILFRTKVDGYQPLWFEATEAGTFTLGWDIHNAVFESLTLVDNITGTSTDMLSTDTYTFQGSPDHYASRFKVVVGDFVEVDPDAPSVPEPVEGPTFAFIVGEQLVVDGEGTLQVFDVTGRQLSSTTLSGTRSTVGLPTVAAGVYVLRLTNENGTKVQKIVFGN